MVHTRHSYLKDTSEEFGHVNGDEDLTTEQSNSTKKEKHHKDESSSKNDEINIEDQEGHHDEEDYGLNQNDEGMKRNEKKRKRSMLDIYDSISYHNDYQKRRSLRKISREENKRFMHHYDGTSRRKPPSSKFGAMGSSHIRRSDRQKKKVFDTFNESEIQREIERKHKEMVEAASMYDAIKRRREEHSDTQDDDEEGDTEDGDSDEGEEEEEEGDHEEEHEGSKAYSLRKTRRKTNLYQAPLPPSRERRRDLYFNMESPMHKKSRPRIPQHASSPHPRYYKRRRRGSSTSSSDDEAAFERRKAKSMTQARSICLPMNFRTEDMVGALKGRERAREAGLAGSSLADVEPMTIDSKTSFEEVGGLDHHIRSLKEMVVFPLLYPEVFHKFGISPPRGVLFYGPPGTGKTLVARALANECGQKGQKVAFFMRKGADCLSKWVGESERQLRLLFDQAYTMRPSIIFFDEIDGIAPVRSTRQDQIHSSIVSTLLALMDGLDARGEIVVIGATNRLDSIDPALRRPGRFDREFLFNLPNRKARQKIIEIQTSSWQPKLSKEFMLELADKCVGYCGADIKALCTEAALFALRRRYPQIYRSNKKYVLDTNEIKISAVDFKNALKSVTPASHRSNVAAGVALPDSLKPLLSKYVERAFEILVKVFPAGKKIMEYDEQQVVESSDEDDMDIYEKPRSRTRTTSEAGQFVKMAQNTIDTCLTHRPRLLIHGDTGNGQTTYVAPSILYAMEHLTTHVVDLPVLFGSSTRTAEEAVSQVFREARRTAPSIIYLPHIVTWWNSVSETTRATFVTLLQDIQPSIAVLFLASADVTLKDVPEALLDLFSASRDEFFEVKSPSSLERREYFEDLFVDHALRAPSSRKKGVKKQFVEILQEAAPAKPRELSPEECKALIESEETTLRELRLFLRNITWKLIADRKYKEFTKPVDLDEVDDYLQVIKEPMDLSKVMTRINAHHYHSCEQFLKEIDLITNNCLEYNPDKDQYDKLLRNRACELRDVAYALVHNDLDPDFEKLCLEINERRQQRGDQSTFAPSFLKVLPTHMKNTLQNDSADGRQSEPSSSNRPMSNIPDPAGTRFSRRVRGLNDSVMYDSTMLELVESNRRRSAKPQCTSTKVTPADENEELNESASTIPKDDVDESCHDVEMTNNNASRDIDSGDQNDGGKISRETNDGNNVDSGHDEEVTQANGDVVGRNDEHDVVDVVYQDDAIIDKVNDAIIDKVKRSLEFQGTGDSQSKEMTAKEQAESLLEGLIEQTAGFSVQNLEQIYTSLCRSISEHKKDENRHTLLKAMEELIASLSIQDVSSGIHAPLSTMETR